MNDILKSAHSGWRYVVFLLLIIAVVKALSGWFGNKAYTEGDRKLNVFALISAHIQLVIGLVLYFSEGWYKLSSAGAPDVRYFKMEHIAMMIIAIILITVGNAKSKKMTEAVAKHRTIAIFFGLALIIIIVSIWMMTRSVPGRTFFGVS
ncbi:cytochrome B [Pedobacter petrophilus]|uniref:Cytochrome B n=1 Tax=Pedobacter petrophilus TaxID=1908241 RepID=A0A7K0G1P9_9SPHI|nr:cytochrome B [Pedobacter petrophilus]MRX77169.1 cytochrome B [Pedobacter petrophilus]